ncbi:NAD(P)/FAD-dependent oxidoreductase [Nocardioides panacihumi]|uniref:NAD(P)/FAD-dependent oxidoreductase n=1 Tax=Nocardioides panacihumi TaxID=400774 RepID=A0ABP5CU09_9ACTN
MEETEVLVVGAGLAGLRCAAILHGAGVDVTVLEAADGIGGRVRTDRVDGFLLDRGFQVVNPWYPALRAAVDVEELGLQRFPAGVQVLTDDGPRTLADPWRVPTSIPATARASLTRPKEALALARWASPLITGLRRDHGLVRHLLDARPDTSLRESLDAACAHGLLRSVLQRYLAGVVLEDEGETSAAFAMLLVRSFVRGTPGLPREGADALPRALAAPVRERIRLGETVTQLERRDDGVRLATTERMFRARRVVVATDAWSAQSLLGAGSVSAPAPKGVVTDWYAVDRPPTSSGILHLDVRERGGPAVNACVVSAAAPTYAPPGRHLIQVTSLLPAGGEAVPETETRRHAAEMLGTSSRGWMLVRRHEVPDALPAQAAPLHHRREQRVDEVTWVCGDHRDTASQQGALVSGARAAHSVLRSVQQGGSR